MTNYSLAFETLMNGSYFKAVDIAYQASLGVWWIFLLLVFTMLLSYMATRNEGVPAFIGLFGSAFMFITYDILPISLQPILYATVGICTGVLIYKAFAK